MVVRVPGVDHRCGLDQGTGAGCRCALRLWGVFTLYMWVATFRANKGVWTVFLLLWITFFLLSAGDFGIAGGEKSWRLCRYFDRSCGAVRIVRGGDEWHFGPYRNPAGVADCEGTDDDAW